MKMFNILIACFFLVLPIWVFAQQDPVIIKYYVHTIRRNNGTGAAPLADFLDEFESCKQDYEALNICFRIVEFTNEDNTSLYNNPGDHTDHFQTNPHSNGVDIYYQKDGSTEARWDNVGKKAIVIGNTAITARDGAVLTHEFTHFFGLLHSDAQGVKGEYSHPYDGVTRTHFNTANETTVLSNAQTLGYVQDTYDYNKSLANITIPIIIGNFTFSDVSFVAMNQITTGQNFLVDVGGDCQLIAGDKIVLNPGFTAKLGSQFVAEIGDACLPPGTPVVLKTDGSNDSSVVVTEYIKSELEQEDEPITENNDFSIYPNPNAGRFTIEFDTYKDVQAEIYVYNLLGKVVYKTSTYSDVVNVDIEGDPKGIYLIRIVQGDETYRGKIVIR